MSKTEYVRLDLGDLWIPHIYETKIRAQRSRAFSMDVPEKENSPKILHTLLGVELKVGKLRIACPELSTARYLQVFARLGVREVAIPYDISRLSGLADELETGWQRLNLLLTGASRSQRSVVIRAVRDAVKEIGPGGAMPNFDTPTRRRRSE